MKTAKYLMTLAAVICMALAVKAQEYKIPVDNSKDGKLTLNDFIGDLPVEGYSGTEIVISVTSGDVKPDAEELERSKGLKPVYSAGVDNTGIGLHVEKNGNQVTVQCLAPITKPAEYKIKVPDNLSIKAESGCERSNEMTVSNMKNEIDIKNCQTINLKNVTGPLVLSTISGDINVTFSGMNRDNPFSISDISGDIDVSLPATAAVNMSMKTVTGNMYTDFDIPAANSENMKRVGGSKVEFPVNGGGIDFNIVNVSGNIYLRKAK